MAPGYIPAQAANLKKILPLRNTRANIFVRSPARTKCPSAAKELVVAVDEDMWEPAGDSIWVFLETRSRAIVSMAK